MQAYMRTIKSTVALLENGEPEELNMRACMGITIQLLRDLRKTVVESGQYNEQVSGHTSKVLAECRSQMGFLFRSVPCHVGGGRVTPEVQRCFLRVMNAVIVQFDDIIKESLDDQNLRDQGLPNELRGDLKKINHNLKLFKKLSASKKQASKRSRKTQALESESKEHNKQLKTSRTLLPSQFNTFRMPFKQSTNIYDSPCEITDYRSKGWQQPEKNEGETFESTTTESQANLRVQTSSTSSDFLGKDLSEMESNVAIVGSYQNLRTQDMQVSWAEKDQPMNRTEYSLPDFTEFEPNEATLDLLQNIESQRSLSMENQQDLQVLWVQKEKPFTQTRSNSSHFMFKEHPHLNRESRKSLISEIPQDLQIQRGFTSSHPRFKELPQIDESELNLKIASRLKELSVVRTVSASSALFKDPPISEKVENQSSWVTESSLNLQVIKTGSTSSNFIPENPAQSEQDGSQAESLQDVQTDNPKIQTGSTASDLKFKNLRDQESRQDLQDLHLQEDKSTDLTSSHLRFKELPQIEESELNFKIASRLKELSVVQTVSASSDLLVKDLPKSENVKGQSSWVTESLLNLQVVKTDSRSSVLPDSTRNIASQKSLSMESREDLEVMQSQKEISKIHADVTTSDLVIFKELPMPEKDKSQTNLTTETPQNLQVVHKATTSSDFISKDLSLPEKDESQPSLGIESLLRSQIDQPRNQTSSTSSGLTLRTLTELELESNMALAGSIPNIRNYSSLRKDLPALLIQKGKPLNRVSFNVSDFLLKDAPQPEKVDSKSCLAPNNLNQVQDIRARTNNPMVLTSSLSDFSDRQTNSRQISSKVTLANTSQLMVRRQEQSRNLEIMKTKSAQSFFSLGKTFGDHRLRLLRWCQEKTSTYGVPMYEFSESWRSGRALVAVIHSYREDLIEDRFNPKGETKESPRDMLMCGAKAAKTLGVDSKVDIVRVCLKRVPDFYQVFTFVGELHSVLEPKLT